MSELQDKPHENTKYNEHLYEVLKQEGLTDRVKWKYVEKEKEKEFDFDKSVPQLPSVLLPKIFKGFENNPVEKDANAQSQQEEQKENQEEYLYDFSYCDFLDDVDFGEVIFTGDAIFWHSKFTGDADFRQATFTGYAYFISAKFTGYAYFSYAKFTGEADFRQATFTGKADFCAEFTGKADFRQATFTGDADFRQATFTGDADFRQATFTGDVDFSTAKFTGKADFCAEFTGEARFLNAEFTGEARFLNAEFTGGANFRYATFDKKAYFRYATFDKKADFRSTEFTGDTDFFDAKFTGDAGFMYAEFAGVGDFGTTKFDEVANFGNSKFKLADFEKSVFKKQAYFLEAIIDTLKFAGTHIETSVHFLKSNIKNTDRETARIIKHEYYKLNNNLEAMRWNTRELEEYRRELKKRAEKIKKLKSEKTLKKQEIIELIKQEPPERLARLVLCFQWLTTRHGTNWLLGIGSILLFNSILFILMFIFLLIQRDRLGIPVSISLSPSYILPNMLYGMQLVFNFINPLHTTDLIVKLYDIFSVGISEQNFELYRKCFYGVFATIDLLFRALNTTLLYLTVGAFRRLSRTK